MDIKKQILNIITNSKVHVLLLLVISSVLLFQNLHKGSLADFDEATYAQISRTIVETGNWTDLQWMGSNWFEKPPLVFWLTALNYKFFGVSTLTTRLWPALFGVLTIIAVYYLGLTMFRNKTVGFFSAGILLTSSQFLQMSRFFMLDVPVVFFITTTLLFYWLGKTKTHHFFYLSACMSGLAVLTKGLTGLIGPLIIIFFIFCTKEYEKISWRTFSLSCLLFFAVTAPWHAIETIKFGSYFWEQFFNGQTLTILQSEHSLQNLPKMIYVDTLIYGFYWWVYLSAAAIFYYCAQFVIKKSQHLLFLLIWVAVIVTILFITKINIPQYILPIYPALALLAGLLLKDLTVPFKKTKLLPVGALIFIVIFTLRFHFPEALYCNTTFYNINQYIDDATVLVHESIPLHSGKNPGPLFYLGNQRVKLDEIKNKYLNQKDAATLFVIKKKDFLETTTFKEATILFMDQTYILFTAPENSAMRKNPQYAPAEQKSPLRYCYPYITMWQYTTPLIY